MTKKNWSDEAIAWETGTGEFDREGTAHNRQFLREDGEGTQYTAPTKDQKWRARDLLDIHWKLTGIKCPESFNRVMSCIVGHVNPNTGACFPRQSTIAIETACHRNTVGRAVQFWVEQKFLETEDRGLAHALAYHPQFKLFEMYYLAVTKDIAAQKEDAKLVHASTTKGVHASTTKGVHAEHQYGGAHNLKVETSKENLKEEPLHEVAHPPSASDAHVVSFSEGKKKRALKGSKWFRPHSPLKALLPVKLKRSSPAIARVTIGSTSRKTTLMLRLRLRLKCLDQAARLLMQRQTKTQRKRSMDNAILFPGWIRVSDGLWHGGKKYRHIGIVKETILPKDWERLYKWDFLRWLRGQREPQTNTGGRAA